MDFSALWSAWQRYGKHVGLICMVMVTFATGWQTGRMMSPYYASHPIMLTDTPVEQVVSDLEAVKQAGIAARPAPKGSPQVASAQTASPSASGQFIASKNSNLYHHPSCSAASRILPANKITFASTQEAEGAGYSPSKCTSDLLKK